MYKLCKTEQSARRQREIEQALLNALMRKNYESVTITELCDDLGMPRKTFYRYFDSKDDALYALIEHTMSEYPGFHIQVGSHRTLKKEFEQYFLFWQSQKQFLDVFNKNDMLGRIAEMSLKFPIKDMVSLSKFLPDDNEIVRKKIFEFVVCGLTYQMISWYREGFKISAADMAAIACRMVSKPLFPNLDNIGIISE